jgi:hypothetical protein
MRSAAFWLAIAVCLVGAAQVFKHQNKLLSQAYVSIQHSALILVKPPPSWRPGPMWAIQIRYIAVQARVLLVYEAAEHLLGVTGGRHPGLHSWGPTAVPVQLTRAWLSLLSFQAGSY